MLADWLCEASQGDLFKVRAKTCERERERFITSDIVLTILLGMALLETQKFTGYTNFKYKLSIF